MPDYYSILASNNRINDSNDPVWWNGASHQVDGGPTWVDNMSHSVMWSGQKKRVQFTVKQTSDDKGVSDTDPTRRIELDPKQPLAADTTFWTAIQVKIPAYTGDWSSAGGIAFLQIHAGDQGGSPTFAIRSNRNGKLWITTRNPSNGNNVDQYGSVSSTTGVDLDDGNAHDFVAQFVINSSTGSLKIWCDQTVVLDLTNTSIGTGDGTAYMKFGIYASGGIGAEQSVQVANVVRPATTSLSSRTSSAPTWPTDVLTTTGAPTVSARQSSDSGTSNAASWVPTLATHTTGDYLFIVVSTDDIDTPTDTTTSGWTRLIQTSHGSSGTVHGAIFYYGSGGVMTAAPSSSVTPPTLTMSTEQATAIAFTVQASAAPSISAVGATSSGTNAKPAELDLGSEKVALWVAALHIDASTTPVVTAGPPGYSNFTSKAGQTTTSAGTYTAEWTGNMQAEKPSPFDTATEQWVCHTIALVAGTAPQLAGRSDETDLALAMGVSVKRAAETDTALALNRVLIRPVGLATTANTAFALAVQLARTVGLSTETDTAFALVQPGIGISASLETDTAFALTKKFFAYKQQPQRINSIQGFGTATAGGAGTISLSGLSLLQNDCVIVLVGTGNAVTDLSMGATGNNGSTVALTQNFYATDTFDTNALIVVLMQGATVDTQINATGLSPSEEFAYVIVQYRGVNVQDPIEVGLASNTNNNSDLADPPAFQPISSNTKAVVAYFAAQANLVPWGPPSNVGNFIQQADSTNSRVAAADLTWLSGVVNPAPVTGGDAVGRLSNSRVGIVFGLTPAPDETNTALSLGLGLGVTFSIENDIAIAGHALGIGLALETDTAFELQRFPAPAICSETNTAVARSMVLKLQVGIATETDTPIGRGFQLGVSQSIEIDTAFELAQVQSSSVLTAAETNTAFVLNPLGAAIIGIAVEIDTARSLGTATTPGLVAETDFALARTSLQLLALGQATEIDEALKLFGAIFAGTGAKPTVDHMPFKRRRVQPVIRIP